MIDMCKNLWSSLPPEVRAILIWIFDKHLDELIKLVVIASPFLFIKRIINSIKTYRAGRSLINKKLPGYSREQIKNGIKYYVWPNCQSVDPAQSDEARNVIAVDNSLAVMMDDKLSQKTELRHFFLLADTGMGKTSFLLNYYARHLRSKRKKYNMSLIPLNVPGFEDRVKSIPEPENTVLLLDAFDEDMEAIKDHVGRLTTIVNLTRDFYKIVITCRTQFFPRDEEMPLETGLIKSGPRKAGEPPQYTFYKIYLSPFSDAQVRIYLKKKFPIWKLKCRKQAQIIADQIPNLVVRPMLLAYIENLIESGKEFKNSYEIYEVMVDAWLERERKQVQDKEALRDFSNKLAVDIFLNRELRGGERIPRVEVIDFAVKYKIPLESWQLPGRSLLNRDAEGNYKFAHRSILEFLFAKQLIADDDLAKSVPEKYWTDQILAFIKDFAHDRPTELPWFLRARLFFKHFDGGIITLKETHQRHEVEPFGLAIYAVTNAEYELFDPTHRTKRDKYSDQDDQPVVYVSWDDANRYCQWLSEQSGQTFRLPTEAEWEFAASGGGVREYPWGDSPPKPALANYIDSKIGKTTQVGSYPLGATPDGLMDMAGNVWEWCVDLYDKDKEGRVLRGGSFVVNADILRCSNCSWNYPGSRSLNIGFRVARVPVL